MTKRSLAVCPACQEGPLLPREFARAFSPPSGPVTVSLSAARCGHCTCEVVLAEQHDENLRRLQARRTAYGPNLLGEDIIALRQRYGLTQLAAAKLFGKGKLAFSRYESEASFPDEGTTKLLKMAIRFPAVLKALGDDAGIDIPLWQERCEDESAEVRRLEQV
jgi:putative zinc finger/helix-turn-helix YgiT family protein